MARVRSPERVPAVFIVDLPVYRGRCVSDAHVRSPLTRWSRACY